MRPRIFKFKCACGFGLTSVRIWYCKKVGGTLRRHVCKQCNRKYQSLDGIMQGLVEPLPYRYKDIVINLVDPKIPGSISGAKVYIAGKYVGVAK